MGAAIRQGLDILRIRKELYQAHDISYFRPWVFLIADGGPTDEWYSAAEQVKQGEKDKAFSFFAVGVEDANFDILKQICTRAPLKLKGMQFRDLFLWLSASQSSVSRSAPGEKVPLTDPTAGPNPKPAPPPILASPPSPPAILIATEASQQRVVPAETLQRSVGIVAVVSGLIFAPFLFCVKPIAVTAILTFVVFGVWWLILETTRRREMYLANREYEEELAKLRETTERQRRQWENWLAGEQAHARKQYEERLRPWVQTVATIQREAEKRRRANADAEQRLRAAEANWHTRASWYGNHFEMKRSELRALRERHESLAREYTGERQRLQSRAREMQLAQFLQQYFISDQTISDIGPTRKLDLKIVPPGV